MKFSKKKLRAIHVAQQTNSARWDRIHILHRMLSFFRNRNVIQTHMCFSIKNTWIFSLSLSLFNCLPRRFRYNNADGEPSGEAPDPQLGPGWGPTFQQATPAVVGSILCPIFPGPGPTGGATRKQGPLLREAQRRLHSSRRFRLSSCLSIKKIVSYDMWICDLVICDCLRVEEG